MTFFQFWIFRSIVAEVRLTDRRYGVLKERAGALQRTAVGSWMLVGAACHESTYSSEKRYHYDAVLDPSSKRQTTITNCKFMSHNFKNQVDNILLFIKS
jgi:hypothetical protein